VLHGVQTAPRPTQSPIQWLPGTISPRVNVQGGEADHPPPSGAEVREMQLYLHFPIRLHGILLN
jgi:hypothetical protein